MVGLIPFGAAFQTDTVFVQAPPVGLERWALLSTIAIAVFVLVALAALVFALIEIRRLTKRVTESVARIEPNVHPVLERARGVTENVERITELVRKDVDRVTESVEAVTGKLNQAAVRMEERIQEFNALVEVVQAEAEGIFLDTASTVHGVRAGALSLGTGDLPGAREEPSPGRGDPPESEPEVGETAGVEPSEASD